MQLANLLHSEILKERLKRHVINFGFREPQLLSDFLQLLRIGRRHRNSLLPILRGVFVFRRGAFVILRLPIWISGFFDVDGHGEVVTV